MRKLIITAAAAVLLVSGCSSSSTDVETETTPTKATATEDPATDAYLSALDSVYPGVSEERAIRWGNQLCDDYTSGSADQSDLARVRDRFEGGGRPEMTDDDAATVIALVVANLCPENASTSP